MRIALFAAGGEIPVSALRAARDAGSVVAVIRAERSLGMTAALRGAARRVLRGPRAPDLLSLLAAEHGIAEWTMRGGDDASIPARLLAARVDLGIVATFPWRLPSEVLGAPGLGTVNVHASLLPRHRGANPWFWTYHADDAVAGVTVHVCQPRVDSGPILAQASWALARGRPVASLHQEVAERGAALLPAVISRADTLMADAVPQDETAATRAPRVTPGVPMRDPAWPVERTWHFLAGLSGQYQEPLRCDGRPVPYQSAPGFVTESPRSSPGTVEPDVDRDNWKLWCRDGFVRLARHAE